MRTVFGFMLPPLIRSGCHEPESPRKVSERSIENYRTQYAALPQTEFVGIGPSGHFVMLDRPQAMEAAIERFLAG